MNERSFRTLDLNLLRVFDEVMAERNLTRAAHNLSMTQPAVSNALRRLRDALGDDLVKRAGYGVEPTPTALALWPTVRDA
ncbi:MAG: LysR family transcriptional regulator, partial [Hydrogenophaga sp.]|nr:LysR family transcriptional regulator [Hydrogenophaga sp.]